MNVDRVTFTQRALDRGKEMGLREKKLRYLIGQAKRLKPNFWRRVYKLFRYGDDPGKTFYYHRQGSNRYPPLLFTVRHRDGQFVVITITVRKIRGRIR